MIGITQYCFVLNKTHLPQYLFFIFFKRMTAEARKRKITQE